MKKIDALKKACPMPVIMAKKEMDQGETQFIVAVDNKIAVENLKKLASNQAFKIEVEEKDDNFYVSFFKEDGKKVDKKQDEQVEKDSEEKRNRKENYAIFVGKDYIGEGDHTLGRSLIQMFFYTLLESEELPDSILFMNAGVKLTVEDDQCIEHLHKLQEKGVEIIVCGTCLNFYQLAEQLQVGTVSNMYDIVSKMQAAEKVITL